MLKAPTIFLYDLTECLANAMDLISPSLVNHHKQVAYLSFSLGWELGLSVPECSELSLAGMLHDVGALSLHERLEIFNFEQDNPHRHTELGYCILKVFEPFAKVADMVRYHHQTWGDFNRLVSGKEAVPVGSHILHLADRIAVSIDKEKQPLGQVNAIRDRIRERSGSNFRPDLVEAFLRLAGKESFWLDLTSQHIGDILASRTKAETLQLDLNGLLGLGKFFAHIIDFRSPFTATHSSGVATVAEALAEMSGFSRRECLMMRLAGYFHDLGKLSVPTEILEKPGKLTEEEFCVIRSHTYHTYHILEPIAALEVVNTWGSFHHERLDGSGYPFHHLRDDLPLGSRIMAVADVFTGITEDRPYRAAMSDGEAMRILQIMAGQSALDARVVLLLQRHFAEINSLRAKAQEIAACEYAAFWHELQIPGAVAEG